MAESQRKDQLIHEKDAIITQKNCVIAQKDAEILLLKSQLLLAATERPSCPAAERAHPSPPGSTHSKADR